MFACDGHFSLGLLSLPQSHSQMKWSSSFIQAYTHRLASTTTNRAACLHRTYLIGRLSPSTNHAATHTLRTRCHLDLFWTVGHQICLTVAHPYTYMQQCYVDRYRSQTSHYRIFSSSRYIQYAHNRKSLDNSMVKQ